MSDNELLLAIADIMDKKVKSALQSELQPLKDEIDSLKSEIATIKNEQTKTNLTIENDIRTGINLLVENYVPAARRYEKATAQIEAMQTDIDVMKSVIREHSEKLQKIS